MSESQEQVHRIATVLPPMPSESKKTATEQPSALSRITFLLMFILLVAVMLTYSPQIAQKIAYSWNLGVEQAKAETAKKLLAEIPSLKTEQRVAWVAKAVSPSVVGLKIISAASPQEAALHGHSGVDMFATGVGSGVIVDPKGYILTNAHVIAGAQIVIVQLSDGREAEAEMVGQDRSVDLAVLRIDVDDLEAAEWGESEQAVVGEQVIAIGSPYGLQQTVTSGIISATERYDDTASLPQQTSRGWQANPQVFMQTDAAINPGNSGGALVDMNGKLIGICTAIISEHGSNSGIGLVIPSFKAKLVYDEIVTNGMVRHGWVGLQLEQVRPSKAQQMNQAKAKGALVSRVVNHAPGQEAGIKKGDVILRWGKTEITAPLHLIHLVLFSKPGTKETVEIFRDGEFLTLEITVGTRPVEM